jgi:hypothetical protein
VGFIQGQGFPLTCQTSSKQRVPEGHDAAFWESQEAGPSTSWFDLMFLSQDAATQRVTPLLHQRHFVNNALYPRNNAPVAPAALREERLGPKK